MSIGKIREFDIESGSWDAYCERLEMYFKANAVSEDKQLATLISVVGDQCYELMSNLASPKKPAELTFKELVALVQKHLNPKPSIMAERYRFRLRRQAADESISQYVAELKKLARSCDFKETLADNLRDQFVCGVSGDVIRQRLFAEENLTYTKAVTLASSLEAAERNAAVIAGHGGTSGSIRGQGEPAGELHRVVNSGEGAGRRRRPPPPAQRRQTGFNSRGTTASTDVTAACIACGAMNHSVSTCRFKEYVCSLCQTTGHLRRVCPRWSSKNKQDGRSRPSRAYFVTGETSGEEDTGSEDEEAFYRMALSQYKPVSLSVCINGQPLTMEIDTGAASSFISKKTFELYFRNEDVRSTNTVFKFYDGTKIKPYGVITPSVTYESLTKRLDLYIVERGETSLMGRQWLAELSIKIPVLKCSPTGDINAISSVDNDLTVILDRYKEVFDGALGCYNGGSASLRVRADAAPVYRRARPLPFALRARVDAELDAMLRSGIIEPVDCADWATPLIPVTKKDGGLFILLMLGFFALGTGCFILIAHPYDFLFKQKVVLQDGGEIFQMWEKPEVDLYIRIFLFNVTNAEDYMAGIADKIIVKEVGPYVYKEGLEHQVLKFNDNGTLSAIPKHPLTWVGELSEGHREDDLLFLPNIALLSIAEVVAKQSFVTRFGLNNLIALSNIQPLVQMTAKEFMMGYKSNLMTLGNTFMPGWIYFDKLGLIDRMYDFEGDYETIYTGEADVRDSGLIDTYRGSKDLPQWQGSHCSNVQGASDGTKFRGGVTRNESLLFFRKSLCRAAPLIPVEEGVKSGLKAYGYTFPEHLFDNGKHIPENKCFCRNDKCLPEGLIDVTECYYGFPIALSYPHFYKGDDILLEKVVGLTPNKEQHETRFWIEPESGLPLDVSAKIQINMALGDISKITNCGRFANLYLPMLWFDIRMYSLPKNLEDRFKMYLNILPLVEHGALYILFPTGAILILLSIYRLAFKVMFKTFDGKKKQRNYIIGSNQAKDRTKKHQNIYAPCEIALNDTESDNSDPQFDEERRPSFFKLHSDRLKELSHRLGDKVYDSVGSVKDRVNDIIHVQKVFDHRKDSLIDKDDSLINDGFKSDSSGDERTGNYEAVRQSDSEDDCRYLEVLDDGSGFDEPNDKLKSRRGSQYKDMEAQDEVMVQISD